MRCLQVVSAPLPQFHNLWKTRRGGFPWGVEINFPARAIPSSDDSPLSHSSLVSGPQKLLKDLFYMRQSQPPFSSIRVLKGNFPLSTMALLAQEKHTKKASGAGRNKSGQSSCGMVEEVFTRS
jgi:hypothetical protein